MKLSSFANYGLVAKIIVKAALFYVFYTWWYTLIVNSFPYIVKAALFYVFYTLWYTLVVNSFPYMYLACVYGFIMPKSVCLITIVCIH